MQLHMTDLDLRSVANKAANVIAARVHAKGLTLVRSVDGRMPADLRGDRRHLHQVLTILLSNAVEATERGEVCLQIAPENEASAQSIVRVRFTVRDTGIGISPDGSDSSGREKTGLAICKQLVELMGGEIGFESQRGKGAAFWFIVPLAKGAVQIRSEQDATDRLLRSGARSGGA